MSRGLAPSAATTWSDIQPGPNQWITQLPATVSITAEDGDGLSNAAAYRYSTDGGGTWTNWLVENLQIAGPVSTTRHITVSQLSLAQDLNFVQYVITDVTDAVAESPALLVRVDSLGPPAPLTPQPQPMGWTHVNDFGASWTNPNDPNGVGGVWYKLDAAPAAADDGVFVAGDDISSLSGVAVTGDGEHSLWLWLADTLGNADSNNAAVLTLHFDGTPPPALEGASVVPDAWTANNSFDLSWTVPDDLSSIAGVRYMLDAPPATPGDGAYWPDALDGFQGYSIPGGADGEHRLWLWPVDGAGNPALPGDAVSLLLRLDTTAPGPPLAAPQITPAGWQTDANATFTATWQNPADLSGIGGACYKLGSEPQHSADGICVPGNDIEQISGIQPDTPGAYHFFLWLVDQAGNVDKNRRQVALDAIQWDPTPPDVFVDVSGTLGQHGWYLEPVDLGIIASDVGSDLATVAYNLDQGGWMEGRQVHIASNGFHTLSVRATDVAGNATELGPDSYNIDAEPPSTDLDLSRTPVYEDWYDGAVTVHFTSVDEASGPDYVEWRLDGGEWQTHDSAVIDPDGEHLLEYHTIDRAGNAEEVQDIAIDIDRFPPVTSYVILPGNAGSGWYTEPVTITLVPADDGAGVAATYYRINDGAWMEGTQFVLSESGEYEVQFYSVDWLGHEEIAYSIPNGIRIDTDAPRAPTPINVSPHAWTRTNAFDLTLAMPPDLSGIAGVYYKVGDPPASPDDGVWRAGSANVLRGVQTPGEGRYTAYVWLKDVAGNVDPGRRGVWKDDLSLAYDATPPTTVADLQGEPGVAGWFVSPVTVTLTATDTLSGVSETLVRIDGAEPVSDTHFSLISSDKHTLIFASSDVAGNKELEHLVTVRIDDTPPGSPRSVQTSPEGWSQVNSFSLVWSNPTDTSGIAGGYYKVGDPPAGAHDGHLVPPIGVTTGITVPAEGAWDIHFWLVDQAGNADVSTRITRNSALRFDGTPPRTTRTLRQGTQTAGGWYTSTVVVDLEASDSGSGVAELRYRIDDGEWLQADASATLTLDRTGRYRIEYQAIDAAGNAESMHEVQYNVDLDAPRPHFQPVDRYQRQSSFELAWGAVDQEEGSGLDGFDLQSRDGRNGPWMNWGNANVIDTSARYFGSFGRRYYFRLRARDLAGNVSGWVELPWGVYVDRLANGDFAGGTFGAWQHGGALSQEVISGAGPQGNAIFMSRLGSPSYGPNVPGIDIPRTGPGSEGAVPVGSGYIEQTLRIPGVDVLDHPTLTFWYRLFTYDTMYSEGLNLWFDTLDVRLIGPGGEVLALRDGLPRSQWQEGVLADLGWRYAYISLPPSWAGETVTIRIENWNRQDGRLNTWSQVADVRLWEPYRLYLPQIEGGGAAPAGQQASPPAVFPPEKDSGLR